MDSNLSIIKIEEELNNYLTTSYPFLVREYIIFSIAVLLACVITPMFLIRVIGKYERKLAREKGKLCKAYLFKSTAKLGLHYALIIFLPILAARRIYFSLQLDKQYDFYGNWLGKLSVILMLFTFIAVLHLFRFRSRGLIETGIVVVLDAVFKHCIWLGYAKRIVCGVKNLSAAARYGYYIMVDSMFARSMAADVAAFGVIVFFTFYYYRRRYLFTPEKLHMSKCVYCGKAIIKGDSFCTCCGTKVTVEPVVKLIEPLDEVRHCRKCGGIAQDVGCIVCDTPEYLEKHIKEKSKEKRISVIRGSILTILFLVCIFIPQMDNKSRNLQMGSAKVNNAFVERWQKFDEQPDIAADPVWLAGFDADLSALYIIDSRWYYIKPRMVLHDNLWFYTVYAEASFMQMEVLGEISELVHNVASGQKSNDFIDVEEELQVRFNETINQQGMAGIEYTDAASPWDTLGGFGYLCVDGLNYYLYGISVTYISIFTLAVCTVMFTYMMNSFSNVTETALERWGRKNGIRAEEYIRRHDVVHQTVISASAFRRIFMAMKSCGCSLLRIAGEIWLLFVRIICVLGLLLSVFRIRNIKGCVRWIQRGLTDDKSARVVGEGEHIAFKREEKKMNMIAVIISILLFMLVFAVTLFYNYQKPNKAEQYMNLADDAVYGYSKDINDVLTRIEDSHILSDDERKQIYVLFDRQIAADQRILDYDMASLDDYLELHAGLCGLCEDDINMIRSIRESLEKNIVPSRQLHRDYVGLRAVNYAWVLRRLVEEGFQWTVDAFFDL